MAKREIRLGVVSYVDANGLNRFGMLGESVDVHDSDVDRFDRLNVLTQPNVVLVVGSDVADAEEEAAPDINPLDGLDEDGLRAYAEARGIDTGRASTVPGLRSKITEAAPAS